MAGSLRFLFIPAAAISLVAAAYGGWATITLDDVPEYLVAGKPATLAFVVRQHGRDRLNGLNPQVAARSGGTEVSVPAVAATEPGRYTATLTLPSPGKWTITINSGFGASRAVLLPIPAVGEGQPVARVTPEHQGQQLFVAKGCFTCHTHRAVDRPSINVGPNLSDIRVDGEYLRAFLANPQKVKGPRVEMPDLGLSNTETASLAAWLSGPAGAQPTDLSRNHNAAAGGRD